MNKLTSFFNGSECLLRKARVRSYRWDLMIKKANWIQQKVLSDVAKRVEITFHSLINMGVHFQSLFPLFFFWGGNVSGGIAV